MSRPRLRQLVPLLLLASLPARAAGSGDVEAWDRVLHAHVRDGGVDYAALAADRADLEAHLASLGEVEPAGLGEHERLAFWINAYNAVVVHFVLERYPGLKSVRDVDGFFERQRYRVGGRDRSLDEIETAARDLEDPRVHFALVCASASCPDLRGESYRGERLDEQLADQTSAFLGDPSKGLRLDERAGTIHLSSIFKWYAGDFTGGNTVLSFFFRGGVLDWVRGHVPATLAERIADVRPDVEYMDYDWSLNDR